MNVERLRMVKQQILKYPDETHMQSIHRSDGCHCIFGWAQVMFSPRLRDRFWRGKFVKQPTSEKELFDYMGMSYAEGRRLYHRPLWPDDLSRRYVGAGTDRQRAEITAEAIERFIADPGFRKSDIAAMKEEAIAETALV